MNQIDEVTKSYLLPVGDLTLTDRKDLRINCDEVLLVNAQQLAIRPSARDLIIRDTLPNTDLGLAAQEDWLIAGAGVVATELQYVNAALPNNRCLAFYGVSVESAPPSISRVRMTQGATSAQTRAILQLEQLYSRIETVGYFSEAIIFTGLETVRIMVMPRLAFAVNTERLAFLAKTIEPIGLVVGARSA